jgi:hypothetical protein
MALLRGFDQQRKIFGIPTLKPAAAPDWQCADAQIVTIFEGTPRYIERQHIQFRIGVRHRAPLTLSVRYDFGYRS